MYVFYNPNPSGKRVGDCVIRAIAKLTGRTWEETYIGVASQGFAAHDMPSSGAWLCAERSAEYLPRLLYGQGFLRGKSAREIFACNGHARCRRGRWELFRRMGQRG